MFFHVSTKNSEDKHRKADAARSCGVYKHAKRGQLEPPERPPPVVSHETEAHVPCLGCNSATRDVDSPDWGSDEGKKAESEERTRSEVAVWPKRTPDRSQRLLDDKLFHEAVSARRAQKVLKILATEVPRTCIRVFCGLALTLDFFLSHKGSNAPGIEGKLTPG